MTIRLAGIRKRASIGTKGASTGALLFLLAFAVPQIAKAENKVDRAKALQQSNPAPPPKASTLGNGTKGASEGKIAEGLATAAITDIKITPEQARLTVAVTTDRLLAPKEFILENPPRLVLDFPNTENKVALTQVPVHAASVIRVRVQQFQRVPSPIARVVVDLEDGFGTHQTDTSQNAVRLVFYKSKTKSTANSSVPAATPGSAENTSKLNSGSAAAIAKSPRPAVPIATNSTIPTGSAAAKNKTPLRSEAPKPAAPNSDAKPYSAEGVTTKSLSSPSAGIPNRTPRAKSDLPNSVSAIDPKPVAAASGATATSINPKNAGPVAEKTLNHPSAGVPNRAPRAKSDSPNSVLAIDPKPVAAASGATATSINPKNADPVAEKSLNHPSAGVPNRAPRAKSDSPNSVLAIDPKPVAAASGATDTSINPKNAGLVAELKQIFPKVELPPTVIVSDSKPASAERPAVAPPTAAVAYASGAPSKAISPAATSRFSGQPLTLDLIDIPLVDFFRLMSEEGGINIVMDPGVKGRVSIKVVKVPWDQIFEAVLANNSLDKQVEGTVVRIASKSTLQDEAKQQESLKKANLLAADLETRIKRLNYAKAAPLLKALEDQKTVRGTIVVEERTNSLILTDIPSSIDRMAKLIEALDVPQPQVEIEARIISATRNFARDIGIQFGFVDGNLQRVTVGGPNTSATIGGSRPSDTPGSTFAAGNSATGRGASTSTSSGSGSVSTGTSSSSQGNYNVNLPASQAFGGLGISIGNIFDTFLLDAAITAGESKGLAKLISQPKVTAQNNSPAVITQGLRFPVQIIANNTITVQFQNAALTLTVTPQITYEGNIILDLKVENNTPDFSLEVNNIPSIRTSESTTRVLVSDGGTTVIGGILMDNESTSVDQVPGLGSLPIIGNLFKRSSVSRSTQEVLFFVTPRIIK